MEKGNSPKTNMETQTQASAKGSSNDQIRMRADLQDQANKRDFEDGRTVRQTVCNTSEVPEGYHPHSVDGIEWHCLRDETNRLLSFAKFPRTAAKSATLLANHGFVYTGAGYETDDATTCYFCGARKKEWQASDVFSSIHHPSCPVVTKTHCVNLPISTKRAGDELQVQGGDTHCVEKTEIQRPGQFSGQNTSEFVDVDIHLSEESALVGERDESPSSIKHAEIPHAIIFSNLTKCKSRSPEQTKVPNVSSHQKGFVPERKHSSKQNPANINYKNNKHPCNKEYSIVLKKPKIPEYVSEDSRLGTFTTWPSEHHLKPCDLSEAGFYYENTSDKVRCFHCGGRLQSWEDTSYIWVEHARWYPKCGHVRQQLGLQFVDAVDQLGKTNDQITYQMVEAALNPKLRKDTSWDWGKSAASKKLSPSRADIVFPNVQKRAGEEIVEEPDNAALNIDTASSKNLRHTTQKERLRTFKNWPERHPMKPCDLSAAGFYYEGAEDSTRCYHCGGALRNWSQSHNVFVLHAKWFPYCSHMRLLMGQRFVDTVQEWRRAVESSPASLYSMLSPEEIETITAGSKKRKIPTEKELLCKMCKDGKVVITFLSCGHLVTCDQCGPGVERCPACQIPVTGRVRAKF